MGETSTSRSEITTPKIVALISLLIVFAEGVNNFWAGYALVGIDDVTAAGLIAIGVVQIILMAGILMIAIIATVVDLKVEILKKLYHWAILFLIGIIMLLLELGAVQWDGVTAWNASSMLGGLLVLIAAGLELAAAKKGNLSIAKLLGLAGVICAIVDIILLIATVNNLAPYAGIPLIDKAIQSAVYYIVVAIICVVLLCAVLQNKINVKLTFSWWLILIIGFIFYTWITASTITGTIILIAFIILLKEE